MLTTAIWVSAAALWGSAACSYRGYKCVDNTERANYQLKAFNFMALSNVILLVGIILRGEG